MGTSFRMYSLGLVASASSRKRRPVQMRSPERQIQENQVWARLFYGGFGFPGMRSRRTVYPVKQEVASEKLAMVVLSIVFISGSLPKCPNS